MANPHAVGPGHHVGEAWHYKTGVPSPHRDTFWNTRERSGVYAPRLVPDTAIDVEADRIEEAQALSEMWVDYHTRSQIG